MAWIFHWVLDIVDIGIQEIVIDGEVTILHLVTIRYQSL